MQYLLDANAFIEAKNTYYRFSFCPAYWNWVRLKNHANIVYTVDKIKAEIAAGNDDLSQWVKTCPSSLFLKPTTNLPTSLALVAQWVDNQNYTVPAKNGFFSRADYYLIAYAHALHYTVITRETKDPNSKKRVKIPDVCAGVNVPYMDPFQLLEKEQAQFICK